jgi:hypothetical protein
LRHAPLVFALPLVSLFLAPGAHADRPKKPKVASPKPASPTESADQAPKLPQPDPGKCVTIQPGVKHCATLQGQGSFDVVTYPPAAVVIRLEEDIVKSTPPPPALFQFEVSKNTATISPVRINLPSRTVVLLTTPSATITINLVPGSLANADTQVTITEPRKTVLEADLERRLADAVAARKVELDEREKNLETYAGKRAAEIIVDELAKDGADVLPGKTGRNSELIVLRVKKIVRIGERRYVVLGVENLSSEDFEVKGVRVFAEGISAESRPLDDVYASFGGVSTIAPNQELQGAVSVPLDRKLST